MWKEDTEMANIYTTRWLTEVGEINTQSRRLQTGPASAMRAS
jgi:hypothetical protein